MKNKEIESRRALYKEISLASNTTKDMLELLNFAKNNKVDSNVWSNWLDYLKETDKVMVNNNFKATSWRDKYKKDKKL